MDDETREALEGSIAKWQAIVDGTGEDRLSENCPLCQIFRSDEGCKGCPVMLRVKAHYCKRTPYDEWVEENNRQGRSWGPFKADTPGLKASAQKELGFLISLRPSDVVRSCG
jgi:hypothetical protein